MKPWHATWLCFAVVLVGAFVPWAKIDLAKAAEQSEGLGAFGALMMTAFARTIEVTAWNGRATIGTAAVPLWVVLLLAGAAAFLALLRARGVRTIPHAAAPILAAAGVVLVVTFGVQALESGRLLAGFGVTAVGALGVLATTLRDPAPRD